MKIETEQDMDEFCELVKGPFNIKVSPVLTPLEELNWVNTNRKMISERKIGQGSHLQQGINFVDVSKFSRVVQDIAGFDTEIVTEIRIYETPYLYPSAKILAENPDLIGPMTGVLANCYDPQIKRFLFHMRGTNIANPFGFQAAAAGMGVYGQHPSVTAALELYQEAGLENFRQFPENGLAIDVLPFMKAGKIPQPLFSFGFLDDLSGFPICNSLEDIAEFESKTKKGLQEKTISQKEGYHFTIPYEQVENLASTLNDVKRFYGPIYKSTINFVRALKDSKVF